MNFTARSRSYLQIVLCVPTIFCCQESRKLDIGIRLNDFLKEALRWEHTPATTNVWANLNAMVQF